MVAPRSRKIPSDPLRIVAIGGGTGLSVLLHGLKPHAGPAGVGLDITAVVTVTDDGGSSGRLRRDFAVLPPGDIRNCMVAMSEDETLLSRLFQYRFSTGRGLKGHSFGNLFLTALTDLTGDFAKAVQLSSEVLASCGRIYPSTAANVVLEALLSDGRVISGESRISKSKVPIERIRTIPLDCEPIEDTLAAIDGADLITLGPGSLFTSVIPNLLVKGIPEAIAQSQAIKAYFVNLMWQPGETMNFRASDHVAAIHTHAGMPILDYAMVNTRPITAPLKRRYATQNAQPVENDTERLAELGVKAVGQKFACEGEKVRHDPVAIAEIALRLAGEGRRRKLRLNG
ncbi:MAG: uridine diphosphate-N-acetylglucosamine-binding protein YvcK [Bryobacteraceae bacterium]